MKHLIKQYYHFFGEFICPEKLLPNSLYCFYHSNDLTHFRFTRNFPIPNESQQESYFCWLFFVFKHFKNQNLK